MSLKQKLAEKINDRERDVHVKEPREKLKCFNPSDG